MNVASSSRGALGDLKRRFYSSVFQASAGPSTSHPRIAPLPHLSVLEVSGPDAQKFLKGLSCKDVDKLGGGYSGFLNASGRVLHTTFIIPLHPSGGRPPTYLITHESPADHPAPLAQLLPPFRLRSKVRIRDVSDEWDVYAAWGSAIAQGGPEEVWKLGSLGAAERQWSWANGVADLGLAEGEVGCWDLRAGFGPQGMGRRVLVPKGKPPSVGNGHDPTSAQEWHLHRLLLGIPEGPGEVVPGQALPLESCMDIHGGVDFRKGCYLGQELTVRTYHTGATRKRILPLRLFPLDSPGLLSSLPTYPSDLPTSPSAPGTAEGAEIIYHPPPGAALKKPRPAGKILSTHAVHTSVGLGLVRVEMADRVWWTPPLDGAVSTSEWGQGARGRLIAEVGGVEMGVYIGQGEAYAASLRAAEIKAAEAESRETHAHA